MRKKKNRNLFNFLFNTKLFMIYWLVVPSNTEMYICIIYFTYIIRIYFLSDQINRHHMSLNELLDCWTFYLGIFVYTAFIDWKSKCFYFLLLIKCTKHLMTIYQTKTDRIVVYCCRFTMIRDILFPINYDLTDRPSFLQYFRIFSFYSYIFHIKPCNGLILRCYF